MLVEDMSRNQCFFQVRISHMFYVLYQFATYLLTAPRSSRGTLHFWRTSRLSLQGGIVSREIDQYDAGSNVRSFRTTRRHISQDFLCNSYCEVRLSPLYRPHLDLLYQPQMIDDCSSRKNENWQGNQSTRRKPSIGPHESVMTWPGIEPGPPWLAAWGMTRPS
jgi:hypothetical protein